MHQIRNTYSSGIVQVLIENTTDETIPAYSPVVIGETDDRAPGVMTREGEDEASGKPGRGRFRIPVRKPDGTFIGGGTRSQVLITLDMPIDAGQTGYATASVPVFVRVGDDVKERGQPVGPSADSWELGSRPGFYSVVDIKTIGSERFALVELFGSHAFLEFKAPPGGIDKAPENRDGQDKAIYPSAMCKAYLVFENENGEIESQPYLVDGEHLEMRVANRSSQTTIEGMFGASPWFGGAVIATYYECD